MDTSTSSARTVNLNYWLPVSIALLVLTAAIELLSRLFRHQLSETAGLGSFTVASLREALHSGLYLVDGKDSWEPMIQAFDHVHRGVQTTIYQALFFDQAIRFQYPPSSLLPLDLMSSAGLLRPEILTAINFFMFCGTLIAVVAFAQLLFCGGLHFTAASVSRVCSNDAPSRWSVSVIALLLSLAFFPLTHAQSLGQIQIWINFFFLLLVIFWLQDRRLLAGFCLSLICAVKPQMGLLFIWAALWGEKRFIVGFLSAGIVILGLSLWRYGLQTHLDYLNVLIFLGRNGENFAANQSVNGIFHAYLDPESGLRWQRFILASYNPVVHIATLAASLFALLIVMVPPIMRRGSSPQLFDLGVVTICTVIGSPVAWDHHYGVLLPIFLIGLKYLSDQASGTNRTTNALLLIVSWTLVSNFIPFAFLFNETALAVVQAYQFWGAVGLLVFFWRTYAQRNADLHLAVC